MVIKYITLLMTWLAAAKSVPREVDLVVKKSLVSINLCLMWIIAIVLNSSRLIEVPVPALLVLAVVNEKAFAMLCLQHVYAVI